MVALRPLCASGLSHCPMPPACLEGPVSEAERNETLPVHNGIDVQLFVSIAAVAFPLAYRGVGDADAPEKNKGDGPEGSSGSSVFRSLYETLRPDPAGDWDIISFF